MRRLAAEDAEIIRRIHDARAEVPAPNPIHDHARRQRMLAARHPASEFETAAVFRGQDRFCERCPHHLGKAALHGFAEREVAAADMHRQRRHDLVVRHTHDPRHLGSLGFKIRHVFRRRGDLRERRGVECAVFHFGLRLFGKSRDFRLLGLHFRVEFLLLIELLRRGERVFVPEFDRAHFLRREAACAAEDARERVIVLLGNGVEFVIVAPHAAERHAHERLPDRVELLVNDVHLELLQVRLRQHARAEREEAGRGHRVLVLRQQIAGDLLDEELIERLVPVERAHHIVAVAPRVTERDIFVHAV